MKTVLIILGLLFVSNSAFADVWNAENQWSNEWESRYSKWVESEWTQDVFKRGILEGLETDCADATYAMRALFAFQNRLPFEATSSDGRRLSQKSSAFDSEKGETDRFRSFLRYIFDETNTKTLALDSFPIAITRNSLKPGTIYLATGEHSYQVIRLTDHGVPVLLSSTTPVLNRVLFQMLSFPFYRPQKKDATDGYRAFRWPSEMGKNVRQISRANFEQYLIPGNVLEFAEAAKKRLAITEELLSQQIDRQLTNICYFVRERAYLVVHAYVTLSKKSGRCFSSSERDEHSTEIRDRRLTDYFQQLKKLRDDVRWSDLDSKHKQSFMSVFVKDVPVETDACKVQIGVPSVSELSLYDVWKASRDAQLSADPNVSILSRWGLEKPASICR